MRTNQRTLCVTLILVLLLVSGLGMTACGSAYPNGMTRSQFADRVEPYLQMEIRRQASSSARVTDVEVEKTADRAYEGAARVMIDDRTVQDWHFSVTQLPDGTFLLKDVGRE